MSIEIADRLGLRYIPMRDPAEKATLKLLSGLEWIGKNIEGVLLEHALRFQFVADESIKTVSSKGYVLRFNPVWVITITFNDMVEMILREAGLTLFDDLLAKGPRKRGPFDVTSD